MSEKILKKIEKVRKSIMNYPCHTDKCALKDIDDLKNLIKTESAYIKKLEAFMCKVAELVNCLPSFADPNPYGGNNHIIRKLKKEFKNE